MKRYHQLDSLRGLAAATVLIHHFLFIFTGLWWLEMLNYTPLRIFKAGHEAVIFFFVLSGFVLSLPFYAQGAKVRISHFLIKRVCRIYIPYIAAVACALLAYLAFYKEGAMPGYSSFFTDVWSIPLTPGLIGDHLLLLGSFKDYALDPVLWSLCVELRISLIFPFLMTFIIRFGWKTSLALGLLLSGLALLLNHLIRPANPLPISSNLYFTLHYMAFFIIGALLAKHRTGLIARIIRLSVSMKYVLLTAGLLIYTYAGIADAVLKRLFKAEGVWLSLLSDWGIAAGVCVLISTSLASPKISGVLEIRPVHFLGNISYSLYLYHCIALFASVYAFHNVLPLWATLIIALAASILLSVLSYKYVEKPAIALGKRWTSRRAGRLTETKEAV